MTTRIEVDFNSRDDAGMVPALFADADAPLRVGDTVEAYDDEGYQCPALVTALTSTVVSLEPLWRAFAGPNDARIIVTATSPAMWTDWKNRLTVSLSPATVVTGVESSTTTREAAPA